MIKIGTPSTPSTTAILENAHGLARYAQIAQVSGRPIFLSCSRRTAPDSMQSGLGMPNVNVWHVHCLSITCVFVRCLFLEIWQ